jgi:hypothetical protein
VIKQPHSKTLILLNRERRMSWPVTKNIRTCLTTTESEASAPYTIIEPAAVITAVGKWYNIDTLQSCVSTYQLA